MPFMNGAAVTFGLESANVVGYSTLKTGYTHQMLGVPFSNVNGNDSGVLLKDIAGNFGIWDEIQFSYMDEHGLVQFNTYFYLNEDEGGECEGWHDGDYVYIGDSVSIPAGAAVWVISQNNDALSITSSGEVRKSAFVHSNFKETYNLVSSAFPVAFNPNANTVTWSGLNIWDELQVAFVDEDGLIQFTQYFFLDENEGGEADNKWHDGDYCLVTEPIAAVGQGFWLITADPENVSFTEKSPIE